MAQAKVVTQVELDQVLRYVSAKRYANGTDVSCLQVSGRECVSEKSLNLKCAML